MTHVYEWSAWFKNLLMASVLVLGVRTAALESATERPDLGHRCTRDPTKSVASPSCTAS